jgi:hypothetical protein
MSKVADKVVTTAEYDAEAKALKLDKSLEDIADRERVNVVIEKLPQSSGKRWRELSGILPKEAGEDFARALEEMFPPWND